MKTGGRDLNTTGLDLKSIGESDGRGRPVSFKEPPRLGNLATKEVAKDAPTAAKLRKLNTAAAASTGARSDNGAKSARRSEVSAGRQSHRSAEPTNPYKDHTVEMMDGLITEATKQINMLERKIRAIDKDKLATKTSLAGKKKPLIEQ